MRRATPFAVAFVAVALLAGDAVADLDSGRQKLVKGDYKAAVADLENVGGKHKGQARLLIARVRMQTGRYAEAEKLARAQLKNRKQAVVNDARVTLAEILRLTGRYADARKQLEAALKSDDKHLRARWMLGLTLRDLGQKQLAEPVFDWFFDAFNGQIAGYKLNQNDAPTQFYVAEAARWLSSFEDANGSFRDADSLDPKLLEVNVEWANMFLEKYAIGGAEQSLDAVLKINPHHADAHVGMALVKLDKNYDLAAASHHLAEALKINPHNERAYLVRASLEIDQNKWDAAKASLAEAFKTNPKSFYGHSLLATVHWLRDNLTEYEAQKNKVFGWNPEFAEFYHIIARSAVREHRYTKAIALEKEAVKVDPKYYVAMAEIGTGYMRLGKEKQGLAWLNKSWAGDEYNARTYNMLELFEQEIPTQYSFTRTKHFKIRYHKEEKDTLHRHVAPLMERAYEDMLQRYQFSPKNPIILELYKDPGQYSVRTVGLPNLGALGVCFGQVITAMSPSVGSINWAMVLWHELAHVFAIQLSNSRVPRWYTEGLSEYETMIARPEWRREHDSNLAAAVAAGTLPSVADLNHQFMKPSMQKVVVAYYLSSVTIEYIAHRWGFDKIVEGLKLFGKGLETPDVIKKITGLDVATFDTKFRKYLDVRLAPYKGAFRLPTEGYDDITKLEIALAAAPKDPVAHAALALGQFYNGDSAAKTSAEKALALDDKNQIALYILAELTLRFGDLPKAKELYLDLIATGGDGFDVRGRLATIARKEGDTAAAIKQLCAAKRLDPERAYPYMELHEIYNKQGRTDEALKELETYVMIEQMQYAPLKKLVTGYAKKGRWTKVVTFGELALNISLFDNELRLQLGEAYLETQSYDKAITTYKDALATKPQLRRPALAHIGLAKVWLAKRNKNKARAALKKAFKTEPANAEALDLKTKL